MVTMPGIEHENGFELRQRNADLLEKAIRLKAGNPRLCWSIIMAFLFMVSVSGALLWPLNRGLPPKFPLAVPPVAIFIIALGLTGILMYPLILASIELWFDKRLRILLVTNHMRVFVVPLSEGRGGLIISRQWLKSATGLCEEQVKDVAAKYSESIELSFFDEENPPEDAVMGGLPRETA